MPESSMTLGKIRGLAVNEVSKRKSRDLELAFVKYECWSYMGRQPKVSLYFTVMEPGKGFSQSIQAHYRLDRFDKRSRCYAKPRSRIVRDLGRLFSDYVDAMPLPLSRLKGVSVIGRTGWVTKDRNNVDLADQQQYEIVEYLLRRTNGNQ